MQYLHIFMDPYQIIYRSPNSACSNPYKCVSVNHEIVIVIHGTDGATLPYHINLIR